MNRTHTWTGRADGPGDEHRRFWQIVEPAEAPAAPGNRAGTDPTRPGGPAADAPAADAVILGFASDEGVRRNHGRQGAAAGPEAIRAALGSLAVHSPLRVLDAGDAVVAGEDLESGHADLARQIAELRRSPELSGALTGVLGGGHETAWGSYLGLAEECADRRLGILNLDAHFDLRQAERPTSGTPFRQIAADRAARGADLDYTVIGISEANNTTTLFDTARELGVTWLSDVESQDVARAVRWVEEFAAGVDDLYLTIDLDVLPAAVAPGVSAPAGLGVPTAVILAACAAAAASGKLRHFDIVELNPRYDVDGRTARTAARLVHEILTRAAAERSGDSRV
ncbi:formimidoylglutamase [Nocardia zapadnayensis]|uniref:formimidoylglutamase n=1 Tax=Brevibacterium sp. R8603A2 TaxID=2929779 RepID=UPI001FFB948D|nr:MULTISPECIES: formimidoylglutamase [Actinomycetes]MCK1803446.1 formimidoylglutamase [Brevibacterium sp. R8603A2]MCX0278285.1 formimidoylglutamase [Nocardia zapadnayensis]